MFCQYYPLRTGKKNANIIISKFLHILHCHKTSASFLAFKSLLFVLYKITAWLLWCKLHFLIVSPLTSPYTMGHFAFIYKLQEYNHSTTTCNCPAYHKNGIKQSHGDIIGIFQSLDRKVSHLRKYVMNFNSQTMF